MFEKGKEKTGGRSKGGKNKRTLVTEAIGIKKLEDAKQLCFSNIEYFLTHKDDQLRLQATREILKYLFVQARHADRSSKYSNFSEHWES
jgi:hypothetical protein